MNLLDKAIEFFSPQWGAQRLETRLAIRHAYEAADLVNRLRSSATPNNVGPLMEGRESRINLIRDSRDLDRNNGWVHGLFNSLADNIIGEGLVPKCRFQQLRRREKESSAARDLALEADAVWEDWAKAVDLSRKRSIYEYMWLGERELWVAGEFAWVLTYVNDGRDVPLAVEFCESERLANIDEEAARGTRVYQGVTVDEFGKILGYKIWDSNPADAMNYQAVPRDLPLSRVIHVFHLGRGGRYRGIPRTHSVSRYLAGLAKCLDFELTRMQTASAFAVLHKRGGIPLNLPKPKDLSRQKENDTPVAALQGGMFITGGQQDSLESAGPTISPAFEQYTQVMLRAIAAGMNVSESFISKDHSRANFGSQRAASIEDRKHWRPRQGFFVRTACQALHDEFKKAAFLAGRKPFHTLDANTRIKAMWRTPGWEWIDPEVDVNASKEAVKGGINSPQRICAEAGRDFFDVVDEIAEARDYCESKNVTLDIFVPDPVAMMEAEAALKPEPGQEMGGSGAKPKVAEKHAEKRAEARTAFRSMKRILQV